jgi:hypothetical protein
MSVPADRKHPLCRFNLHDKWVRRFNQEDGEGLFAVRGLRRTTQLRASKDAMTVERRKLDVTGGCGAGGGGW